MQEDNPNEIIRLVTDSTILSKRQVSAWESLYGATLPNTSFVRSPGDNEILKWIKKRRADMMYILIAFPLEHQLPTKLGAYVHWALHLM